MTPECTKPSSLVLYVVDARPHMESTLRTLFGELTLPIRFYLDAEKFLADLTDSPRGCLICQLGLPGRSGLELLQELQLLNHRLPAVVMAEGADLAAAVSSMQAGAVDYIENSVADARLFQRVVEVLRREGYLGDHRRNANSSAERR